MLSKRIGKGENERIAKKLRSVFTDDLEHCIETGRPYCHIHHIFYGIANRRKSEKYGFVIPIAAYLHQFCKGSVHNDPNTGLDLKWKQKAQEYYEEHCGTRDNFIKLFGRNYL
jgi:hypothetical protein